MKVIIDIQKEFERDLQDKFNEFFERVKCDIDSSLKSQEVSMCGNYERETAEMFLNAFENATVIPDNATNGDVIKAVSVCKRTRVKDVGRVEEAQMKWIDVTQDYHGAEHVYQCPICGKVVLFPLGECPQCKERMKK